MKHTVYNASESTALETLAQESSETLCSVQSVFPFDFFPTTITVSRTKIDVIDQLFFFSKRINSFLISEIGRIEVTTGLLFSTILFRARTVDKLLVKVSYLNGSDAIKVQNVIQGLLIAKAEKVNMTQLNTTEVESSVSVMGQPNE